MCRCYALLLPCSFSARTWVKPRNWFIAWCWPPLPPIASATDFYFGSCFFPRYFQSKTGTVLRKSPETHSVGCWHLLEMWPPTFITLVFHNRMNCRGETPGQP